MITKLKLLGTLFAIVTLNLHVYSQEFSSPALQWNMPASLDYWEFQISQNIHQVIDKNGDGKLDLVDSENQATSTVDDVFLNGNQKYWKVYINNSPNLGNSTFGSQKYNGIVYPNPVRDILNISFESVISSITIYNFLGQEVLSKSINAKEVSIDIYSLTSGTYFVKVTSNDLVKTLKVYKE